MKLQIVNTYNTETSRRDDFPVALRASGDPRKKPPIIIGVVVKNPSPRNRVPDKTVRIGLGNTCIEIGCRDRVFLEKVRTDYLPFLVSHLPDFRVEFNLRDKLTAFEVRQFLTKVRSYLDGDRFFTVPELLECRINWPEAVLRVDTEKGLFNPDVGFKLMNALMCGIYAGIYKRVRYTRPDAYLVHGCGIVNDRQCYLFTGPSGSGKTTIARLSRGRKVLNDEAVLIGRNHEGYYISGTPFEGGISIRCNTKGRLSAIFFLKHDGKISIRKLSKVETYQRLLPQVFDTSPLFKLPGFTSLSERADLSAEIATQVPSYELSFCPDTSFWEVVEHI